MKGLVIKNTGSWYIVKDENGDFINCKIKGNFRIKGIRTTNPIAVGDNVEISLTSEGTGFITHITPRRNYIIRRASNLSKESHIIASNIDQTFLIVSLSNPTTSTIFIDRFLATAEAYRVPAIIVINKIDLLTDESDKELLEAIKYLYESIGYRVILASARTDKGIDEIKDCMAGKISLFSGNSGVGKSTLINSIIPELKLRTADISSTHHTGMHTTTFSEMYEIENGFLIDTPGVKGFGTIDFDVNEVAHFFPEIFKISNDCKYNNCSHTHEPGCAVLQAVDESKISQSRYASYLSILEDINEGRYRKPF